MSYGGHSRLPCSDTVSQGKCSHISLQNHLMFFLYLTVVNKLSVPHLLEQLTWYQKQLQAGKVMHISRHV